MHGNVFQWCQDWYGNYHEQDVIDPQGPEKGEKHLMRGGSWHHSPQFCRSTFRFWGESGARYKDGGFRLCFFVE
jgi:formylglycine-generating enzyme required for sulfatase activity